MSKRQIMFSLSTRQSDSTNLFAARYCFRHGALQSAGYSRGILPAARYQPLSPIASDATSTNDRQKSPVSREVDKCAGVRNANRASCQRAGSMSRRSAVLPSEFARATQEHSKLSHSASQSTANPEQERHVHHREYDDGNSRSQNRRQHHQSQHWCDKSSQQRCCKRTNEEQNEATWDANQNYLRLPSQIVSSHVF